jgi:transposase
VLCMETLAKIHRRYEVNGESISRIARALKPSRNTVIKYLKQTEAPEYTRCCHPKPKLGNYERPLRSWLVRRSLSITGLKLLMGRGRLFGSIR